MNGEYPIQYPYYWNENGIKRWKANNTNSDNKSYFTGNLWNYWNPIRFKENIQVKLDIDKNLWNNAHQFYRVATLHPGDDELMWNTFLRYVLGVNLLQTSFGFLGAGKKWGNILSFGTGVGLKSYDFFKNSELKLDILIPLGKGVNLDIKFDLNADPNNLTDVKGVDTTIGISCRF